MFSHAKDILSQLVEERFVLVGLQDQFLVANLPQVIWSVDVQVNHVAVSALILLPAEYAQVVFPPANEVVS